MSVLRPNDPNAKVVAKENLHTLMAYHKEDM